MQSDGRVIQKSKDFIPEHMFEPSVLSTNHMAKQSAKSTNHMHGQSSISTNHLSAQSLNKLLQRIKRQSTQATCAITSNRQSRLQRIQDLSLCPWTAVPTQQPHSDRYYEAQCLHPCVTLPSGKQLKCAPIYRFEWIKFRPVGKPATYKRVNVSVACTAVIDEYVLHW